MEITYQVIVDGMPVRFDFSHETSSSSTAWKSYGRWASNPQLDVSIDELHNGQYYHTLRNSVA